ncbi:hypothetical protein BJ741DRAFT_591896 [Chytriomyces cf. hyalinus JEL632]|nr:hypothetical protein BJ741DRAFT_591896 [Chytriomyces cf. hyalinus JEL632]
MHPVAPQASSAPHVHYFTLTSDTDTDTDIDMDYKDDMPNSSEELLNDILSSVTYVIPVSVIRNLIITMLALAIVAIGSLVALAIGFFELSKPTDPVTNSPDNLDRTSRSKTALLYCVLMVVIGVHAIVCMTWIATYALRLFRRPTWSRLFTHCHDSYTSHILTKA